MPHRPYLKGDDDQIVLVWEITIFECASKMWPGLTPEQFGEVSHVVATSSLLEEDFSLKNMLQVIGVELTKRYGAPLSLSQIAEEETKRAQLLFTRISTPVKKNPKSSKKAK